MTATDVRSAVSVQNVVFKTVEARRYQDQSGPMKIRIDHNSHLSQVSADGERLRVDFQFTTSYGALGVIKMEGTLIMGSPDAATIAKEWSKTRKLPPTAAQQVHTAILQASVPDAVALAKQIRLPPPIPLPQVRIGQDQDAQASPAPVDAPDAA